MDFTQYLNAGIDYSVSPDNMKILDQMDRLYDLLGGDRKTTPQFLLHKHPQKLLNYYFPETNQVYTTNEVSGFGDALRSHELAHSTGLLGKIKNKFIRDGYAHLVNLGQLGTPDTATGHIHSGAQVFGGGIGNAASGITTLLHLAEEGQANLRGALALRKLQGKLTKKNLAAYGLSMGSYLGNAATTKLILPKAYQQVLDYVAPGFAKKNKVLVDYLIPDK